MNTLRKCIILLRFAEQYQLMRHFLKLDTIWAGFVFERSSGSIRVLSEVALIHSFREDCGKARKSVSDTIVESNVILR